MYARKKKRTILNCGCFFLSNAYTTEYVNPRKCGEYFFKYLLNNSLPHERRDMTAEIVCDFAS